MAHPQTIAGDWNQVKGKLREKWGSFSDDELDQARGNLEQLVGVIQRRSGESREAINEYLEDNFGEHSWFADAKLTMQRYRKATADQMHAGYIQGQRTLREHPAESLAVCFAAGMLTGIVTGLLIKSR